MAIENSLDVLTGTAFTRNVDFLFDRRSRRSWRRGRGWSYTG
jgi:hypothetical protein